MPYCKLCAKYLDKHPEAISPTNSGGAALNRLLEVRELGGLGQQTHTTLPGQELHRRAEFEAGIVAPPEHLRRPQ
jgi:hypothetical protein